MAMAVDNRQQPQLSGLGYDPLRGSYAVPHFTNPWVGATSAAPSSQLYPTTQASAAGLDTLSQAAQRPSSISMPYSGLPVTADLMNTTRSYAPQYTAATSSYVPATSSYPIDYKYGSYGGADRRSSHPSVPSIAMLDTSPIEVARARQNSMIDYNRLNPNQRTSFSDAVEASRGMLAMSSDITPRNIYGDQGSSRSSSNSYGFPSTHSAHSSISSQSTYPSYYNGSVAESVVSDYSSASESVDMNSRTLPRPSTLMGGLNPPAPQSMMGQFSSKVSSSSQKKHKCKICDKRFTRPSSLQTHMYSHTGEKPFACEVEGCGRHFSVVSNLRRHRKVHKNDGSARDAASPEEA